ncbi:MAG TPA: hypothetical protein PK677_08010 [Acidiphilium sp.]|nr:hypothetical protein [Acidiphilium sp.]HQU23313.1 hypothetical protein [Acidiphilium sp.]
MKPLKHAESRKTDFTPNSNQCPPSGPISHKDQVRKTSCARRAVQDELGKTSWTKLGAQNCAQKISLGGLSSGDSSY